MGLAGRNDPCPCGSGRKFKRCCLASRAPGPPFTPADRERALAGLIRFAHRSAFDAIHEAAEAIFWGEALDGLPGEEADGLAGRSQGDYAFHMWLFFDFPIEPDASTSAGRTLADLFLTEAGPGLGAGSREYLTRMRPTHVGLYEVLDVQLDEGLRLVDLWTDQRLWVRERRATRQLVRWELLAARLMPGAEGELVIDGPPYAFPAIEKERLVLGLREAHRDFVRSFPGRDLASFFKHAGALLHQLWLGYASRPAPVLVTAEGDPFVFAKVVFDVRDEAAVRQALAAHPDLAEQGDGSYVWLEHGDGGGGQLGLDLGPRPGRRLTLASARVEPGREPRRSLGTLAFAGHRLVLETTSRSRARRGRRFLERLAGGAVRFRATRYQDVDRALATRRRSGPRTPELPPELKARLEAELMERHYRTWVDTPVPMLGDRTPRDAARLDAHRPALVALLKELESQAERARRDGRLAYDPGWLWSELGLARPE